MKKTLLFFAFFIIFEFLFSCSIAKKEQISDFSFPIYGNYCGPFHPPIGMNPVAINDIDLACQNHDICYESNGYFNEICDMEIIENLKSINPNSESEKLARKLLIFYFQKTKNI